MTDYSLDQQIQIVQEGRKRGFTDSQIAGRLGLSSDDAIFTIKPTSEMLGLKMSGIAEGWREWQFFAWPKAVKEIVIVLLARIAEASYRRGLQQGFWAASTKQKMKIKPDDLRWGSEPLDSARMPLCGTRMSSRERLHIQHGIALADLGLIDADDQHFH